MEFVTAICPAPCGAVVFDGYRFRGLVRPICPRCKQRVWVQGDGKTAVVTRVDSKPSKLPKAAAA